MAREEEGEEEGQRVSCGVGGLNMGFIILSFFHPFIHPSIHSFSQHLPPSFSPSLWGS